MQEKDLRVFIDSVLNYFDQSVSRSAETGTPYVKDDTEKVLLEYSGLIGISGKHKGCIYFTATKEMLTQFTRLLLGDEFTGEEAIRDMVGEIANNISGYVSEAFGSDFMISVPAVISGDPTTTSIKLEVPTYVIPLTWENHRAFLVVGISETN